MHDRHFIVAVADKQLLRYLFPNWPNEFSFKASCELVYCDHQSTLLQQFANSAATRIRCQLQVSTPVNEYSSPQGVMGGCSSSQMEHTLVVCFCVQFTEYSCAYLDSRCPIICTNQFLLTAIRCVLRVDAFVQQEIPELLAEVSTCAMPTCTVPTCACCVKLQQL